MSGNDLNGCDIKTDTANKCQKLCQETTGCVQFTWLGINFEGGSREKECCMKNEFNGNYGSVIGAFSGPQFCGKGLHFFKSNINGQCRKIKRM